MASIVSKDVMVTGEVCKRGSLAGKPFHLTRNVSKICDRRSCLIEKRPWAQLFEG